MLHEVKFPSFNERDQVYGWIYVPACQPLGIIQLIHGFGEHSRRYLHMITSFMEAGYIVAADDMSDMARQLWKMTAGATGVIKDLRRWSWTKRDSMIWSLKNTLICHISCTVIPWVPL